MLFNCIMSILFAVKIAVCTDSVSIIKTENELITWAKTTYQTLSDPNYVRFVYFKIMQRYEELNTFSKLKELMNIMIKQNEIIPNYRDL